MTRIEVERHDSVLARWEMVSCKASAALAPHVRGYLGYAETTPGPFQRLVGLAPKVFGRILRFQHAARELSRPDGPSLCEIALDCGYYDQAHLNRDFREFAGRTPTELIARRLPDGGGYLGD